MAPGDTAHINATSLTYAYDMQLTGWKHSGDYYGLRIVMDPEELHHHTLIATRDASIELAPVQLKQLLDGLVQLYGRDQLVEILNGK
jgi:hypothetical protein